MQGAGLEDQAKRQSFFDNLTLTQGGFSVARGRFRMDLSSLSTVLIQFKNGGFEGMTTPQSVYNAALQRHI